MLYLRVEGVQRQVYDTAGEAPDDTRHPSKEVDEVAEDPQIVDECRLCAHGVVFMPHNYLTPAQVPGRPVAMRRDHHVYGC